MEYSEQVYYRTSDRPSPHNAYLDAAGIAAGIDLCGYRTSYKDGYDGFFQFASETEPETLEQGRNATYMAPGGYFHNNPWFSYDEVSGTYLRYQFGEPQIDEMTQEQLAVKNIIVQYCSWKKYDDNAEYLDIDMIVINGAAVDLGENYLNAVRETARGKKVEYSSLLSDTTIMGAVNAGITQAFSLRL